MSNELPIEVSDRSLPFHSPRFDYRDFEDLCADLFENEFQTRFHPYGRRGDPQRGIDLISESKPGAHCIAVQCKKVQAFKPSDVEKEIEKLETLPILVSQYYLAVSCGISSSVRDTCYTLAKSARTSKGQIQEIHVWGKNYLSRQIRKYPNLVASYFGLDWRNHLFPDLKTAEVQDRLDEITSSIVELKQKLGVARFSFPTVTQSSESLVVAEVSLIRGVEGYFRTAEGIATLHGDFPSNRGFSFKYSMTLDRHSLCTTPGQGNPAKVMISMVMTPEDTVDLEAVLVMDKNELVSHSTYYSSHNVLLTHISGPCPMLSFPSKDISFMFAQQSDYDQLLRMVNAYLDNYRDTALAARRERILQSIAGGVPKSRAWLFGIRYDR